LKPEEIEKLDAYMEPKLSPEEQAARDAALAELDREEAERKWDGWGSSPHQLASQQAAMELLGVPEG
jgi:hypothetical protein